MATATWGGGDVETTLQGLIDQLTTLSTNLTSQIGNYSNSTLEWSQAIQAINDRAAQYQQAINQYQQMLDEIRWSADTSKRGSAMKEQAKKWYITGLATKRGMTHAEAMKDLADIEWAGRAERAEIESQKLANLAWTRQGLAGVHMNIAQQEWALADAAAARRATSGGGSWSSALQQYLNKQWLWSWDPAGYFNTQPHADDLLKQAAAWVSAINVPKRPSKFWNVAKHIIWTSMSPMTYPGVQIFKNIKTNLWSQT